MLFVLQYMRKFMFHPPWSRKKLFLATGDINGFTNCDRIFFSLTIYPAYKFCQPAVFNYSEFLGMNIDGNDSKQEKHN